MLDPSRVAAQIVSGIGFVGGAASFSRNATWSAASPRPAVIWLTAAVGMACGAGFAAARPLRHRRSLPHRLCIYPAAKRILSERAEIHVRYTPGKGSVEKVMQMCAGRGYSIQQLAVERSG